MNISIEREGQFDASSQCGDKTLNGPRMCYKVIIKGAASDLNKHGWLIDNLDLANFFARRFAGIRKALSCEEIAITSCRELNTIARKSGSTPRYIKVSVQGIPGSWITSEWGQAS